MHFQRSAVDRAKLASFATTSARPPTLAIRRRRVVCAVAARAASCEMIEPRVMLNGTLQGRVPLSISPISVNQTLLAPGVTVSQLTSSSTATAVSAAYRFTVNNVSADQQTTFSTSLASGSASTDAAIALYDASGNRIALQDTDTGGPGVETLSAALQSGQQYIVAFDADQTAASSSLLTLKIDTGPQAMADTVALNPATGTASLTTSAAPNAFDSAGAVRYLPLSFLDAGSSASVSISGAAVDSAVAASLFVQQADGTWLKTSSATFTAGGSPASLAVTPPPSGGNVTDGTYLLAIAPLNYSAAPEPVTINLSASSLLVPSAVSAASASGSIAESVTGRGTLGGTVAGSFVAGGSTLYAVTAAVSGPLTITYTPTSYYIPLLGVYGPAETALDVVRTGTVPQSNVTTTINAIAGQTYYLRAGIIGGSQAGTFNLSVAQTYTTIAITATTNLAQQSALAIAPSQGTKAFRLSAPSGSNYVAVQLAPDAGSTLTPTLSIVQSDGSVQSATAAGPGQPVTLVISENGNLGPYDIVVSGGTGSGTASLKYVALNVANTVSVGQFPTAQLNFQNGGISSAALPVTTGVPVGFQYYQPSNGSGAANTLYNVSLLNNGTTAILLHYVQDGSTLRLVDQAAPTGTNQSANVFVPAQGPALHAVVALPVNFGGSGSVQVTVGGPKPTGLGIATTPNALPGQGAPAGGYQSIASLANGQLGSSIQRDLYAVQVPFNATSTTATLHYNPSQAGSPLAVTINVLNAQNVQIATATSTPGGLLSIPISGLVAGQPIRFEVKSAGGNLGNGSYALSIAFATSNPLPFLVTQDYFYPYAPPTRQVPGKPYLPNTTIPTIPVNGSLQGNFTSSTPYSNDSTGSIQVYQINGWTANTPFSVQTTDIDSGVNTNFALYTLSTDTSGATAFKRLNGTAPSFDYLPADRTNVDSKIVVNNTDLDPVYAGGEFGGPITVYVVVMNEQGTQGRYNISVTQPVPLQTAGPGTSAPSAIIVPAPRAGAADLTNLQTLQTKNGQSFSLRTPTDMSSSGTPTLTVATGDFSSGQTISVNVGRGFVNVGTASATVVNGVATIQLVNTTAGGGIISSMLGPNNAYTVTVTASSFPTAGLKINLTVPYATQTGTVPPSTINSGVFPTDAGYNSSLSRIRPAPNGSVSESIVNSGGFFYEVFSLSKAGTVSFTVNSASGGAPAVGLYQAGKTPTSPYQDISVLLNYDNTRTSNNFVISENLPAGTYWLRGQGFDSSPITLTGTLPALNATVLNVEPGTGITSPSEQTIINQYAAGSTTGTTTNGFTDARYASSLFNFVVPANANGGPVTFSINDFSTYSFFAPTPPVGTATVTLYRFANGVYTQVNSVVNAVNASTHQATVSTNEPAVPGAVYFAAVDFNGFQYAAYVGFNVPVYTTGIADFAVQPVHLSANAGSTIVQSAIVNGSFTASSSATYALQMGGVTSTRVLPPLAPFGSLFIYTTWNPVAATDGVTITANPGGAVPELSSTNNSQSVQLSSVDLHAPTATISLSDAAMTAEGNAGTSTGGTTWGRYISGVTGQNVTIRVAGSDSDADLYQIVARIQNGDGTYPLDSLQVFYTLGTANYTSAIPFDFGRLQGTSTVNLNQLRFYAIDVYGLRTPVYFQSIDVAAPPSFLTGGAPADGVSGAGGTITFNASTHKFSYSFTDHIISISKSLSDLLGTDVPVIGDKTSEFLVEITGKGTSGLSPTTDVQLDLTGHAKLTALEQQIFDKSYTGGQVNPNVTFNARMALAAKSLVPSSTSVSLQVTNLQLLNYKSPLIPLLEIGAPGIAELKAGVKFGVNAKLNAGAKIGFDPTASGVGGYLGSLGIMSPTFVQPTITGTATVTGEADVLGFDIADVSGSIGLTLTMTLGLDNNVPGKIIPFAQAPGDLALSVDASINIHLSASVWLLGEIYSYDYNHDFGNIVNTIHQGIFVTDPPDFGAGHFVAPGGSSAPGSAADADPTPVIKNGSSLVGAFTVDPHPQIAINNSVANGMGLSMQVVNAGTATAPLGNLAYSIRNGGAWSSLTTLGEGNDVSAPELALTHDGAGTPGVVVYSVDDVAGSPATQTFNQRLTSQDLRYRYFNGTSWSGEQTLTSDSLYDSQQSLAFNASGAGAVAWVHNNNATPMNGSGMLDSASNDIRASIWNVGTHTWGAPTVVTTAAGSDTSPATFVDASGKSYVVWIHNAAGVSQLMYATSTGGAWSSPAVLNTSGLAAGGTFRNVAIGSDGSGRVNVLFAYQVANADGSLATTLYERPATTGTFASLLPAVQIAANSNFSGLSTTSSPSGALVAYWQQSDGQSNQIFETTITNGIATTPTQLSDSHDVAQRPSLAVDGDNKLQLLYSNTVLYGGTSQGAPTDPGVGTPLAAGVASSSAAALPQLSFSQGLAFPVESQSSAAIGSQITGTAVIVNRGLAGASVTITAYNGPNGTGTVVGQQTINLPAGASFNVSQIFTVLAGTQQYSLKLTSTPAGQAFSSTENLSTATLRGLSDLSVSLTNDVGSPAPGSTQTLYAFVQNNSAAAVGAFTVAFYAGDPRSPQSALTLLGTQAVSGLAANAGTTISLLITLPGGAGDDIYTAVVDSNSQIEESNESNNVGRYEVGFRADPTVSTSDGTPPITATLVDTGTSNNVQVTVTVRNLGAIDLSNVPVDLRVSRDGGAFTNITPITIPTLAAGTSTTVTFTLTAKAGDNLFVASIDPLVNAADLDLTNNAASTSLTIEGLPSLTAAGSLDASTINLGGALSLNTTITNAGLGDADDVPLVVLASLTGGGPSYQIGTSTVSVDGLGSASKLLTLDTSHLSPGTYTITLQLDPNQTIVQGSVAGNTVTFTLTVTGTLALTGANEYLKLDADGTHLDIWHLTSATGSPAEQFLISAITSLSAAVASGNQNVTIDFSNGRALPASGMTYNGLAAGSNQLRLIGTTGADSFNMNGAGLTFSNAAGASTIGLSNVTSYRFDGDGGNDPINLNYAGGYPLPRNLRLDGTFTLAGFQSFNNTTIDLDTSTLYVSYTSGSDPIAAFRQALHTGYNNGLWNGAAASGIGAINTSAGAADPNNGLGFADYGDGSGVNPVLNTIELKYTRRGDLNLDGKVDFSDLLALAKNYNQPNHVWDMGDFDFDGSVQFSDLLILAKEYGTSIAAPEAAQTAPSAAQQKRIIDMIMGTAG